MTRFMFALDPFVWDKKMIKFLLTCILFTIKFFMPFFNFFKYAALSCIFKKFKKRRVDDLIQRNTRQHPLNYKLTIY